jgi:hypothetical protein
LLGQHLFLGKEIEKEKKEKKGRWSQTATRSTIRATEYRWGCREISNTVGIAKFPPHNVVACSALIMQKGPKH